MESIKSKLNNVKQALPGAFACGMAFCMLCISFGLTGPISGQHRFALVYAIGILGTITLISWNQRQLSLRRLWLPLIALLLIYLVAQWRPGYEVLFSWAATSLFAALWQSTGDRRLSARLSRFQIFLILGLVYYSLFIDPSIAGLSLWRFSLSQAWTEIWTNSLLLNPSASGLDIVLLALLYLACYRFRFRTADLTPLVSGVSILFVLFVASTYFLDQFAPGYWDSPLGLSEVEVMKSPYGQPLRLASFFDLFLPLSIVFGTVAALFAEGSGESSPPPRTGMLAAYYSGCACLVLFLAVAPEPASLSGLRVGLDCQWDLHAPGDLEKRPPGMINTGMYGLFLRDLNRRGVSLTQLRPEEKETAAVVPEKLVPPKEATEATDQPAPEATPAKMPQFAVNPFIDSRKDFSNLKNLDVVLAMVREKAYTDQELQELQRFISEGGLVIMVGDHTDLSGCMRPFNQIGSLVGIQLAFDSAFSFSKWWFRNVSASRQLGYQAHTWLEYGVGTGGSLTLTQNAVPLLSGPFAFSDLGNRLKSSSQEAFLGDYRYQHGELLGDVCLLAKSNLGKGCVVGIGDSSMFQNISYTRSSPFVRHILGLNRQNTNWSGSYFAILLGIALGPFILTQGRIRWLLRSGGTLALIGILFFYVQNERALADSKRPAPEVEARCFIVDAHGALINRDPFSDDSHLALPLLMERLGYATEYRYSLAEAFNTQVDVIFLHGLAGTLSQQDVKGARSFLEAGGTVVVSSGVDRAAAVAPLLNSFQIKVLPIPLGGDQISDRENGEINFVDCWKIHSENPETTVLVERLGQPVAVSIPVGKGNLLVFGDSKFFLDRNLETEKTQRTANYNFVQSIFSARK